MASVLYNSFKQKLAQAKFDFSADTFYAMLVTATYAPNIDTDDFRNDVTNEVVGTGYTADGKAIAAVLTLDTATDTANITFGDVTWPTSTITARAAVIYKRRGGLASADELVAYVDFGSNKTSSGGTFTFHPTTPLALT